jgi:hypothetical protein
MGQVDNKYIAQEILLQLGGRQFLVMTGTKNLVWDSKESTLTMRLTRNKIGAKWMKIHLNSMDLYDVAFLTENKTLHCTITLWWRDNIYADQLRGLFERETGLRTSLTHTYSNV